MTGRWALLGHGLLALAIVGFVAACGGDDDDDNAGSGGSAGSAGTSGSGGMSGSSGKGGSGGTTAGSGGAMSAVTAEQCVMNSMKETATPMACLTCVCGKDPVVIDKVDMPGWKLIECIGNKCDGVGTDIACITAAPPAGCMDVAATGAATATPTGMIFPMCKTECGIGDMPMTADDGGTPAGGGDAGL